MGLEISQATIDEIRAKNTLELAGPRYILRDIRTIPTKKGGEFTIFEVYDSQDDFVLEFFEREVISVDGPTASLKIVKQALKAATQRAEDRRAARSPRPVQ